MKRYLFIFFIVISIFSFSSKVYALDYLSSLNASGTDLTLEDEKFNYYVNYNGTSGSTKIYATLGSDKYRFVSGYGPRVVNLNFGNNEVFVKVIDESGEEITYTINITRKDERVDNNYLNNIVVNGKALNFDSEKQVYSFSVSYSTNKLNIKTSTIDTKARYNIIGGNNLAVGDNTVKIEVYAESGKKREYILNVYRSSSNDIPMSSNTRLALLKIIGYDIDFNSDNHDYKVMVKEEKPLEIYALAEDENSVVKIVGNRSIKHNDIVEVRVIAEDGSQDIYKIKVVVEGMSNIDILTVVIIVLSVFVLISGSIIIVVLLKKKKSSNGIMNFEVVRNDIPKIDVEKEENKELVSFLLGKDNNLNEQIRTSNTIGNSNDNMGMNNLNPGSVIVCSNCSSINNRNNTNCSNCGNKLGG